MHIYAWGLFGKEHTARKRRPPFEWLEGVVQETPNMAQAVANTLRYPAELIGGTLLLKTGHILDTGL